MIQEGFGADSFFDKLQNWESDAKCMAALSWRPMDSDEADFAGRKIAETFNLIMENMGLDVRLSADMLTQNTRLTTGTGGQIIRQRSLESGINPRTHYELIELFPGAAMRAIDVLVPKLWDGNEVEKWAAEVFTYHSIALLIPSITDEEKFRRECDWQRLELLGTERGDQWQKTAAERDKRVAELVQIERAKEPECKRLPSNWPRRAGFYLTEAQIKASIKREQRKK